MTPLSERLNSLRASILGANDGIVSVSGILVGVAAARPTVVLITALLTVAGGALSMGLGEYVSVAAQKDAEKANGAAVTVNPITACLSSAAAFTVGAVIPTTAMIVTHSIGWTITAALIALALAGWLAAVAGEMPWQRSTLRIVAGGAAAMGTAFILGTVMS